MDYKRFTIQRIHHFLGLLKMTVLGYWHMNVICGLQQDNLFACGGIEMNFTYLLWPIFFFFIFAWYVWLLPGDKNKRNRRPPEQGGR